MDEPSNAVPSPPRGTGAAGRRLWRAVMGAYELDGHHLEQLREAIRVADLVAALDKQVAEEGLTVNSPQGLKSHPSIVEARQHRALLARLVAGLGLPDGDVVPDGRRRGKPRPPYQLHAVGS